MHSTRHATRAALAAILLLTATGTYAQTAGDKLGRGLSGMAFGVLALPGVIVEETQLRGPVGVPIGIAEGLGMVVTRELVGVYEFLTAPFPIPANYRPILKPPYPWDYFHQDKRSAKQGAKRTTRDSKRN
jgi:putative exosortase-associated protein (TIGR04073 family)